MEQLLAMPVEFRTAASVATVFFLFFLVLLAFAVFKMSFGIPFFRENKNNKHIPCSP